MQAGDLDRAESALRTTLELGEHIPEYQHLASAPGFLGAVLLHRGQVDEATGLLEEAAALTARHQLRTFYAVSRAPDIARRCVPVERRGRRRRRDAQVQISS